MKKAIFLFILSLSILSCVQNSHNEKVVQKHPLSIFVDSFLINHPNYFNNEYTIDKTDSIFKAEITPLLVDGVWSNIPLVLKDLKQKDDSTFYITLGTKSFANDILDNYELGFDIIGSVKKRIIDSLIEGKYYYITGNFERLLDTKEEIINRSNERAFNLQPCISKYEYKDNKYSFFLGVLLVNISDIVPK